LELPWHAHAGDVGFHGEPVQRFVDLDFHPTAGAG
jgi:hypothetical protein